jgi:signal transduction histidine kinase
MEKEDFELVLPLNRKVQLNGVVLLGKKGDNLPYTVEEIQFLESLIINSSMAFGRSILYQQVENLNKSLQQKVQEQTSELQEKVLLLEEARRKEADMIDIMGHELRTPATVVKLNADLLSNFSNKVFDDRETFDKYVSRIKEAVETEIKLINTLLSSAKLEGDKIEINMERVDIYKEVDMALHGEERHAQEKGLEIINNVSKETPPVYADHARVVEVLNNLISNAVKYTEKGSITC